MEISDQTLAERSADVDYYGAVELMSQSLFYGMFLVVFGISILILQQRKPAGPRRVLFGSIMFIGIAMTTNFSLIVAGTLMQMSWPHLLSPSSTIRQKLMAANEISRKPFVGTSVVTPLVYIIADAMPIWRAYVMWSHSRNVKGILLVLFGLNIASCILQAVFVVINELQDANRNNEVLQSTVYATSLLFSVLVNATSTSLIGYQAWNHRANIKKGLLNSTFALSILVLIVEAGFALCIIQIINASVSIASSFVRAAEPLNALSLCAIASYPSLLVIIMGYKKSVLDTMLPQDSRIQGNVINTIQFAPSRSTNDATEETINPRHISTTIDVAAGSDESRNVEKV
ncbi:hypothetical protein DL96DRAFT_1714856 [Flagelloscypha sp. PMI_526]|nr:hypothetical protein DL96DRAFT_1714856 [Flagelloscypha sp. PMI_526]